VFFFFFFFFEEFFFLKIKKYLKQLIPK